VLVLVEKACAAPDDIAILGDDELTAVLSAAVRLYAARAEALERFAPPIDVAKVTPTEALVTISEMIRAINVNMFDLSMWHERQGR
jgi:hypothetical protein